MKIVTSSEWRCPSRISIPEVGNFDSILYHEVLITHNSCNLFLSLAYFSSGAARLAEQMAVVTWNCFQGLEEDGGRARV